MAGCSSDATKAKPTGTAGAGGSGGGSGGGAGSGSLPEHILAIDGTGYMKDTTYGIQGAWYAYGDALGTTGMPPGDCQAAGHSNAECSNITLPLPGSFPNTLGAMQTTGSVEQVVSLMGMTGCEATATMKTNCDYSAMWGAGIGVDLNNAGAADGGTAMKLPYDAAAAGVIGIAFDLTLAADLPGLRVEFPMPNTVDSAHVYKPGGASMNYLSPVSAGGHFQIIFATDLTQPDYVTAQIPFDSTQMMSVQFHIPTSTSAGGMYDITVSNFSAITAQ